MGLLVVIGDRRLEVLVCLRTLRNILRIARVQKEIKQDGFLPLLII